MGRVFGLREAVSMQPEKNHNGRRRSNNWIQGSLMLAGMGTMTGNGR